MVMVPLLLNAVLDLHKVAPPPFNLDGARLLDTYPLSIPLDGQALDITLTSHAGELHFGLTGCRRSVPRLQRMLAHLEESLQELETAVL